MDASARVAEIKAYLQYLQTEWPSVREKVAEQLAPRCRRCILSSAAVNLTDGLCEFCRSQGNHQKSPVDDDKLAQMSAALDQILRSHQSAGTGRYDALLLFSGGKDSAYLLHRLRSEYPDLRLLAVTVDNGFFSSVAMENAKRIVQRIPVDHMVHAPQANLYRKTFRHAFLHVGDGGCYETVDRMDGDLAFDIGRNLAATMHIPLMIAGLSPTQVEKILGLDWFESPRDRECSTRNESAGFPLESIYDPAEMHNWWDGAAWPIEQVPRVVYPFYAWRYDEQFVRDEVVRLGLIEPEKDNPLATNNHTIPLMLAVDACRNGYSSFEPEFAELVRAGKANRAAWLALFQSLEHLAKQGRFLPDCVGDTLHRLDLKYADVAIATPEAAVCA